MVSTVVGASLMAETLCPVCEKPVGVSRRGRAKIYCSNACRLQAFRAHRANRWDFGSQRPGRTPYRKET